MSATYAHLTAAHRDLLTRSEHLARDVLGPIAHTGDEGRVNRDLVAALSSHGLVPEVLQRGREVSGPQPLPGPRGPGQVFDRCRDGLCAAGAGAHPILAAGRAAVADVWIPRVAAGEAVAAFALTEPGAGSDVAALALAAEPDGDGFRLSGEKVFVSNAPDADMYTVFARTTPGAGARGITAFAVPGGSEGLSGDAIPFIADHPIGRLHFDGVPFPGRTCLARLITVSSRHAHP